jgi:hypothetical protein
MTARFWPPQWEPVVLPLQQGSDGYQGASDTYINRWSVDSNYGSSDFMFLRTPQEFGETQSPLLHFDLTLIPADSIVAEATLNLYVISKSNDTTPPIEASIYGVLAEWLASEATWNEALSGAVWESPGCNGPGDRRLTWDDQQELYEVETWVSWDVSDLARTWVADAERNQGLILKAAGEGQVAYSLLSSDDPRYDLRPHLVVSYWLPQPGM